MEIVISIVASWIPDKWYKTLAYFFKIIQDELESPDKHFIVDFLILFISENNDSQKYCQNSKCKILYTGLCICN